MKTPTAYNTSFFLCSFVMVFAASCNSKKTAFHGSSSKLSIAKGGSTQAGTGENADDTKPASEFQLETPNVSSSLAKRDIWFVSKTGIVQRYTVTNPAATTGFESEKWTKTGQWSLEDASHSGHRTYVSEAGLIIGKSNSACLYRIGEDTPNGSKVSAAWCGSSPMPTTRFCVTSFKVDGVPYVGGGYMKSDNTIAFARIPIDKSKPNSLNTGAAQEQNLGAGSWGYSCFTDQSRNIYWSAFYGNIHGLNLNTGAKLAGATDAPNAAFNASPLPTLRIGTASLASYAVSGDAHGNILNGESIYTYAYEPLSKTVFGTTFDGRFTVTRQECFTSKANCVAGQDHWVWSLTALGAAAGPLSSLNDGRVVGISREGMSQIFLFSLKDYKNPGAGVNVKKIADAEGDGYMYTDFTGATLYAATTEKSADLSTQPGWVAGKNVASIKVRWVAESGQPEDWHGLKLEARCYSKSGEKTAYAEVTPVPAAGTNFPLTVGGCKSGKFDTVDLRISPDGSTGGFSQTRSLLYSVGQAK